MLINRIDGQSTLGYGKSRVDFRVSEDSCQATIVLGKKKLARLLFSDLVKLQRFMDLCEEGIRILPPTHADKWVVENEN